MYFLPLYPEAHTHTQARTRALFATTCFKLGGPTPRQTLHQLRAVTAATTFCDAATMRAHKLIRGRATRMTLDDGGQKVKAAAAESAAMRCREAQALGRGGGWYAVTNGGFTSLRPPDSPSAPARCRSAAALLLLLQRQVIQAAGCLTIYGNQARACFLLQRYLYSACAYQAMAAW